MKRVFTFSYYYFTGNPFYQPDCLLGDMDVSSANGNVETSEKTVSLAAVEAEDSRCSSPPSVPTETPKENTSAAESTKIAPPSTQPSPTPAPVRPDDHNNNQRGTSPAQTSAGYASPSPSPSAPPALPKVWVYPL